MVFIGTVLYKNKYSVIYPPIVADCPDYWLNEPEDNKSSSNVDVDKKQLCYNVKNLGNASCNKTMDFTTSYWQGSEGKCHKSKWAKDCDLTWDGITNKSDICKTTM